MRATSLCLGILFLTPACSVDRPSDYAQGYADALDVMEPRLAALEAKLAAVSVDENGDVYFTNVNVHILNGSGTEDGTPVTTGDRGTGNLIMGYPDDRCNTTPSADDPFYDPAMRGGSHNVVVGHCPEWGANNAIVAGQYGKSHAAYASVLGGIGNTASGPNSVAVGGGQNVASGFRAVVAAGDNNEASGDSSFVGAGGHGMACAHASAIVAGYSNITGGTISGDDVTDRACDDERGAAGWSAVVAGDLNSTSGALDAVVVAGELNRASGGSSAVVAGTHNITEGGAASISGGQENHIDVGSESSPWIGGGYRNGGVMGNKAAVVGGESNNAAAAGSVVVGGVSNQTGVAGLDVFTVVVGGGSNNSHGVQTVVVGGSSNDAADQGDNSVSLGGCSRGYIPADCEIAPLEP